MLYAQSLSATAKARLKIMRETDDDTVSGRTKVSDPHIVVAAGSVDCSECRALQGAVAPNIGPTCARLQILGQTDPGFLYRTCRAGDGHAVGS